MGNKAPHITLPQGGGAISGMGEKFSADLFTGTGNFSVPITVPQGRNGLTPQLTLGYSTGSGNGPWGLGWGVSVPGVMRKTDKGIPKYNDEEDIFILSGAEDLVPIKKTTLTDPNGSFTGHSTLYRPRTEGLFARIEHIQDSILGNYWLVRSKDGLVSYYGTPGLITDDPCVIADPDHRGNIFAWHLSRTEDTFGNHVIYVYSRDISYDQPHVYDQLYLSTIFYADYNSPTSPDYLIRINFLYEDRTDAFSTYKQGFEIRTTKRCASLEIFTDSSNLIKTKTYHFTYLDEIAPEGDLPYNRVSMLAQLQIEGHDGEASEWMPPVTFSYSNFEPIGKRFYPIEGPLPSSGLASPQLELVDLTGNGLPDILEMNGSVRWYQNMGNAVFARPVSMSQAPSGLNLGDPGVQMLDANGDGRADLLVSQPGIAGYFSTKFGGGWDKRYFQKYETVPTFSFADPTVRLMDIDGDGITDALKIDSDSLVCFFNDRTKGFYKTSRTASSQLDGIGALNFSDPRIHLADMTGDGMQDLVMIYHNQVSYWPNLGYGRFGKRVIMRTGINLPFDYDTQRLLVGDIDGDGCADIVYVENGQLRLWINRNGNSFSDELLIKGTPQVNNMNSVRLADITGSGVSGILWTGAVQTNGNNTFYLDFTEGNKPYLLQEMDNNMGSLTRVEYKSSLYYYLEDYKSPATRWKTELPFPVLVVSKVEAIDKISLGKLTTVYSYHHGYWDGFEREFRGFGRVEQQDTETFDRYNADGLQGAQPFNEVSTIYYTPPVLTKSWFHQGAMGEPFGGFYEADLSNEYWKEDPQGLSRPAGTTTLLQELSAWDKRDALRTLRGTLLRSEMYALDTSTYKDRPYTVSESVSGIRQEALDADTSLQKNHRIYKIFFPFNYAQRSSQWERGYEPMTSVSLNGSYDQYGQLLESASLGVPRGGNWRTGGGSSESYLASASHTSYIYVDTANQYMTDRALFAKSWDATGSSASSAVSYLEGILVQIASNSITLPLIGHSINYYDGTAFTGLPYGEIGTHGLQVRSETLIITDDIIASAYGGNTPPCFSGNDAPDWSAYPADFVNALQDQTLGYTYHDTAPYETGYYISPGSSKYDFQDGSITTPRGLVLQTKDTFGATTTVDYDTYDLLPLTVTDPVGMFTTADYDYRVLQPWQVTDPNENRVQSAFSPLGLLYKTAVMGKVGENVGDTLDHPTSLLEYDFFNFMYNGDPIWVKTTQREQHYYDNANSGTIVKAEYSDGFGRLVQTRAQMDDVIFGNSLFGTSGLSSSQSQTDRAAIGVQRASTDPMNVTVSGWKVYNNKGKVVEQYEPFFDKGFDYKPVNGIISAPLMLETSDAGEVVFQDETQYRFGTGNFTLEAWVSQYDNTTRTILSNQYLNTATNKVTGFNFYLYNGAPRLCINDGTGNFDTGVAQARSALSAPPIYNGALVHIVVQRVGNNPANFKFYLNGVDVGCAVDTYNSLSTGNINNGTVAPLSIGARYNSNLTAYPFTGLIGQVRMYNRQLTATEVANNYKAGVKGAPATTSGLVFWTPLSEGGGTVVHDTSNYGATGSTTGSGISWKQGLKTQCVRTFYDPRGVLIRTLNPDNTQQKVVLGIPLSLDTPDDYLPTPWESYTYDANDLGNGAGGSTYANWTPSSVKVDALGRSIETKSRLNTGSSGEVVMLYSYDIRGNLMQVKDANGQIAFQYLYDLKPKAGKDDPGANVLWTHHIDAGDATKLVDALARPVLGHDAKTALALHAYDVLSRPYKLWAQDNSSEAITLRNHMVYGDNTAESGLSWSTAQSLNLLGKAYKVYDEAGVETMNQCDFKGNVLEKTRQVIDYTMIKNVIEASAPTWNITPWRMDWTIPANISLYSQSFVTDMNYDALNRVTKMVLPVATDGNRREIYPTYGKSGRLITAKMKDSSTASLVTYIDYIAYNARGQVLMEAFGNSYMTRYAYDPLNFRLLRVKTEQYGKYSPMNYLNLGNPRQDYAYTYDLVGNILSLSDKSPQAGVSGSSQLNRSFGYDALYRLLSATGRENGYTGSIPEPWNDYTRSEDVNQTKGYTRQFTYDKMGNIQTLTHTPTNGSTYLGFTRTYAYNSGSNKLASMTVGGNIYRYVYDNCGNIILENTERNYEWDYGNNMRVYRNQISGSEPSVYAEYLYDTAGNRVMKVVRNQGAQYSWGIYDGAFEFRRDEYNNKQQNYIHIEGAAEVRIGDAFGNDTTPAIKYLLKDQVGSCMTQLDSTGGWIDREEYFPYGETSFGSYGKKRYRFCGKERDEESSLYYYGARYYAPWLCRFTSVDPQAMKYNYWSPYCYAGNNPVMLQDHNGEGVEPKTSGTGGGHGSGKGSDHGTSGNKNASSNGSGGSGTQKTDTVRKGEGPWSVAKRNKISMQQLAEWNKNLFPQGLKSGTYMLHPGDKLKVSGPNNATNKSGQSTHHPTADANKPGTDWRDRTMDNYKKTNPNFPSHIYQKPIAPTTWHFHWNLEGSAPADTHSDKTSLGGGFDLGPLGSNHNAPTFAKAGADITDLKKYAPLIELIPLAAEGMNTARDHEFPADGYERMTTNTDAPDLDYMKRKEEEDTINPVPDSTHNAQSGTQHLPDHDRSTRPYEIITPYYWKSEKNKEGGDSFYMVPGKPYKRYLKH